MEYMWDYLDEKGYNNNTGRYKSNAELTFIIKNCKKKDYTVLDIAGGSGRMAIPLVKYSNHITVTDINQKALEILDSRNLGISTVCGDFSTTNFKEVFALIICIEGLDYFKDYEKFFNKVSALLTADGKFIFTYTNPGSWRYTLRKIKHWGKPDPYNVVKLKDFKKLLTKCNLEIDNMEGFNWTMLPVVSNSILVHFFAFIEKKLKLYRWYSQSPWLMIAVKKTAAAKTL